MSGLPVHLLLLGYSLLRPKTQKKVLLCPRLQLGRPFRTTVLSRDQDRYRLSRLDFGRLDSLLGYLLVSKLANHLCVANHNAYSFQILLLPSSNGSREYFEPIEHNCAELFRAHAPVHKLQRISHLVHVAQQEHTDGLRPSEDGFYE